MKALQKLRIFVFILMIACLIACLTACGANITLGSASGGQSATQEPSASDAVQDSISHQSNTPGSALGGQSTTQEPSTSDAVQGSNSHQSSDEYISVDGATVNGDKIEMTVGETVESVAMTGIVKTAQGYKWKLYSDILGQNEIVTKIATTPSGVLNKGNNVFYIVVMSDDDEQPHTYELNIFRNYKVNIRYIFNDDYIHIETVPTSKVYIPNYKFDVEGYEFEAFLNSDGSVYEPHIITKSETILVRATPKTFYVTFDAGSGYVSANKATYTYGEQYNFPTPKRDGYEFDGWYNDLSQLVSSSGTFNFTKDITLTARWTAVETPIKLVNLTTVNEMSNFENGEGTVLEQPTVIKNYRFLAGNKVYRNYNTVRSEDGLYTFTNYVQFCLNSNTGFSAYSCQFSVVGPAKLVIYCNRSYNSVFDPMVCLEKFGGSSVSKSVPDSISEACLVTFEISEAGDYAIFGRGNNEVNVYAIGLTQGQQGNPPTTKPDPIFLPTKLIDLSTAPEMASYFNDMGDVLVEPIVIGGFKFLDKNKAYQKGSKVSEDGTYTFTKYIQLGNDMSASYYIKSCQFYSTSNQTLVVYCNRSSTSAVSPALNLVNEEGLIVESKPLPNDSLKAYHFTFTIAEAGNYAICGSGTGVNVFAIGIS